MTPVGRAQSERKERQITDFSAQLEDLGMSHKQLTEAVDKLKAEIAEM